MNTEAAIQTRTKSGAIAVRPYFDPTIKNMGLENYGLVVQDGCLQTEQLTCIEQNGTKRYLTGLNEFAREVLQIKDEKKKEAVIKEIRTKVIFLEKAYGSNVIDIADKAFWEKVKTVHPSNDKFWDKVLISVGNEPVFLDPEKPEDLVRLCAIEAGGFSLIAKSLDEARARSTPPKFYLDKYEETASTKTEVKKLRNKALAALQELYDTDTNKLFYVAKVVDGNSAQYRKTTPNDVMYDNMDRYITAQGIEVSPKRAAKTFIEASEMDMETLILKSIVRDSSFYKFIILKGDGHFYDAKGNNLLGKNPEEILEYLKNPMNAKILKSLEEDLKKHWA